MPPSPPGTSLSVLPIPFHQTGKKVLGLYQIDPLIMAWITLANWGLLLHLLKGPNWRAYWLGCFAAGLGVITKGVGVLALLLLLL